MAMSGVTVDFNANLARFTSSIDKATSDLNRFQSNTQRVAGNLKAAFGAIGAGVAAIKLAGLVKDSIDAADRLYDLSLKTGASVKALASLDLVATQSGTSIEEVGKGINKLSIYMAQNAEEAKALGITAADPVEAYIQLADALTKIESPQLRAATASKILGKSYQDQLPLLLQGGAAISAAAKAAEGYAKAMEKAAPMADEFNDQLAKLKQTASIFGTESAIKLLPALNDITLAMTQAARESGLLMAAWVALGGLGALAFTDEFKQANVKAKELREEIERLKKRLDELRTPGPTSALIERGSLFGNTRANKIEADIKAKQAELKALEEDIRRNARKPGAEGDPIAKSRNSEIAACLAAGGKWKNNKCEMPGQRKKASREMNDDEWELEEHAHLTRTLYDIQIEASEEYEAQLKEEFEAEWELIEAADDRLRKMRDAADGYKDLIDPIEKYRRQLEEVEQLKVEGFLTPDQATEALFMINEQIDGIGKVNEKLKEGKTFAEEFGLAFESAFEDAIVSGKSFGDVLKALEQDIARIIIRKSVTEPLGGAISSIVKGIDFGSIFKNLFPSFDVGTPFVKQDTMAFVHKGEAIIPAQYNKPGAMGGVNIVQNINIDSRSDQATIMAAMNQAKEAAKADILASIRRGGTFSAV